MGKFWSGLGTLEEYRYQLLRRSKLNHSLLLHTLSLLRLHHQLPLTRLKRYVGNPQAHEDDTQRAVRAGLGIIEAVEALNTSLAPAKGITLALRLGLHTGLVVVGAMGGGGRQEQLALGETPNVAARIQGLAAPDAIVISETTYRLIQGYFECQDLGAQTLRGVAEPIHVYR